jgi:hypothetical protein
MDVKDGRTWLCSGEDGACEERVLGDPRLDSVHLGCSPRRGDYRRARDLLLGARGGLTLAGEWGRGRKGDPDAGPGGSAGPAVPFPTDTKFLLVEPAAGQVYPLRAGLNTIGRLPANDIVCAGPDVSRRHCVILVHARGGCELHDTASRNGTLVNGRRVGGPVRLTPGDEIQVCRRRFLFVRAEDYRGAADDHPNTALLE